MFNKVKYLSLAFLIIIGLIIFILSSCQKEEINKKVDYKEFSSEVGPEGKIINFYANESNIPDNLFPTIEILPNTFNNTSIVSLKYERIKKDSLMLLGLTTISDENYIWYFSASDTSFLNNPIKITIPFPVLSEELMLDYYKHLFKLYKINKQSDYSHISNWKVVENFENDLSNYRMYASIDNFNYGYCILFNEIQRDDNYIITIKGDYETIQRGSINIPFLNTNLDINLEKGLDELGYNYYDFLHGFHFDRKNLVSKTLIMGRSLYNTYLLYFEFDFKSDFEGNMTGLYKNEEIDVKYLNTPNDPNDLMFGEAVMDDSKDISINVTKYGNIGEIVEGTIEGALVKNEDFSSSIEWDSININVDFRFIRTR